MKKQINLFFDFEFTSLSPDAQPISLGIVSDTFWDSKLGDDDTPYSKSFYAEFSDFDLNRCDEWVKENVVSKLMTNFIAEKLGISFEKIKYASITSTNWSREYCILEQTESEISLVGNTWRIKEELKQWLKQFKDYDIQFICDCGTFDFYHLLQLIGEWDMITVDEKSCSKCGWLDEGGYNTKFSYRIGLPKLPPNISPVPQDLNDFIATKKGISVKEAFELNREKLGSELNVFNWYDAVSEAVNNIGKHNALWDAKVIKAIYESLK